MDPISVVQAIFSTAVAIQKWIDLSNSRNSTIRELKTTVSRISSILSPLLPISSQSQPSTVVSPRLNPATISCLQDLGETLSRTREHLSLWTDKRSKRVALLSFLSPSTVLDELQDDEKRISQRVSILAFALQVSDMSSRDQVGSVTDRQPSTVSFLASEEVRKFWTQTIGNEVSCCPGKPFCASLSHWLNIRIDEETCDVLLLRLDEFAVGGVTPSSLDQFVGQRTIFDALNQIGVMRRTNSLELASSIANPQTTDLLLIWIDDNPTNNEHHISHAHSLGITVVTLMSTASAKVWIEANDKILRRADQARRLRFISDNARWESSSGSGLPYSDFLNLSAGETILRYLRGRQFTTPVLIFTGASINLTHYVLSYWNTGSTWYDDIVSRYIEALRSGRDDRSWIGFNVEPSYTNDAE